MTEPKAETVQLPEPCRLGLLDLYGKAMQAKREYELSHHAALSALGIDNTKPNHVDLDTGVVTLGRDDVERDGQ